MQPDEQQIMALFQQSPLPEDGFTERTMDLIQRRKLRTKMVWNSLAWLGVLASLVLAFGHLNVAVEGEYLIGLGVFALFLLGLWYDSEGLNQLPS